MSDIVIVSFAPCVLFLAGLWIGGKLEAIRWRRNADDIQRIESSGKLYKVFHDKNCPPAKWSTQP